MKKLLIRGLIALVVLLVLTVIAVGMFLDGAIKKGIQTVAPRLTKVEVKLDSVSLSLLSGSGKIKGLVVGNPEGYKTPSAIEVGTASLALEPRSILADKVIIRSINVQGPEVTFETDLKGNNLSKILANLQEATGDSGPASTNASKEPKASKKLQVDEFLVSGGKIRVGITALGSKTAVVPLPEIRLADLGKGPDGITAAELTKVVLQAIEKNAAQAASGAVADLSKEAANLTRNIGNAAGNPASNATEKVTKGIGDLLKKK
jgi:uncharacterized protein involved in outer membrane biogenesis